MGHARALVTLADPKLQVKIFEEIIEHGYSVRKVEELVKSLSEGETVKSGGRKIAPKRAKLPEEFNMLKQQLSGFFSTKVQLTCSEKGKGKISIPFNNEEDLERIIGILDIYLFLSPNRSAALLVLKKPDSCCFSILNSSGNLARLGAILRPPLFTVSPSLRDFTNSSTLRTEYPCSMISSNIFTCSFGSARVTSARACPMSICLFCMAGAEVELELTPQKIGLCRIRKDKEPALYCTDGKA